VQHLHLIALLAQELIQRFPIPPGSFKADQDCRRSESGGRELAMADGFAVRVIGHLEGFAQQCLGRGVEGTSGLFTSYINPDDLLRCLRLHESLAISRRELVL
jgi:hypothetical protein